MKLIRTPLITAILISFILSVPSMSAATPQSIAECKKRPNGDSVTCEPSVVTAVFGTCCMYIEQPNRACGIKVQPMTNTYSVGDEVSLSGVIWTTTAGERYIQPYDERPSGNKVSLSPIFLPNNAIGGSDWFYAPSPTAGQRGVTDGFGLNNVGLLVKTSGLVKAMDMSASPAWFEIDDGSGAPIKVILYPGDTIDPGTQSVMVTGICSLEKVGSIVRPVIRVRDLGDIVTNGAVLAPEFAIRPPDAAPGQTVAFDGRLSEAGMPSRSIVSYEWDFDYRDSFAPDATGLTPSTSYATFGVRTVALRVTDSGSPAKTSIFTRQVNVTQGNLPPVADAGGPYGIGIDETIILSASNSSDPNAAAGDSIASYQWDLDNDGQYDDATGVDVSLPYAQVQAMTLRPGYHTIGLRVTDSFGLSDTASGSLCVCPYDPLATFVMSATTVAPGTQVTLDGSASAPGNPCRQIVNYEWDFRYRFDEPFTVMATGPVVTFTPPAFGAYSIALRATDNSVPAKSSTTDRLLLVSEGNRSPVAQAHGPYEVDEGASVYLSAGGSSDPDEPLGDRLVGYSWDLNADGSFTDAYGAGLMLTGPQLSGMGIGPGKHVIGAQVTDSMGLIGRDYTTLSVYVNRPTAAFTAKPGVARPGMTISFDGRPSSNGQPDRSIVTYQWDFDYTGAFAADATGAQVTHTYSTTGGHAVALRVMDNNSPVKTDLETRTVIIQNGNLPPVPNAGGPYTTDTGSALVLNGSASYEPDAATGDAIASYRWDLNGDGVYDATGAVASVPWAQLAGLGIGVGDRTIKLTVTDAYGASAEETSTLTVCTNVPTAAFMASPPEKAGCAESCYFDGTLSSHTRPDRHIVSYEWDFAYNGSAFNTMASGAAVSHTYSSIGSRTVALRVTDDNVPAKTSVATKVITVEPRNAPIARVGGPYTVDAGSNLVVDGRASSDVDVAYGDSIVSYKWDLRNLGAYDDGTGSMPTIYWGALESALVPFNTGRVELSLKVTDTTGRTGTAMTFINVCDNRPTPRISVASDRVVPGQPTVLSGKESTHGRPDRSIVRYEWCFNYTGSYHVDAVGQDVTCTFPAFGAYTVALWVFDDNSPSKFAMTTMTIVADQGNLPPVAHPGAPYSIAAGSALNLDGSVSYDPNEPVGDRIVSWEWDLDGDTQFDDAAGDKPSFSWAQLQGIGVGTGTRSIYLRVTDTFGVTSTSYTKLTVR